MAVPKKKISRSRRNMRRFSSAYKMDPLTIVNCPSCNTPVRPHTICGKGAKCHDARSQGQSASAAS